MIIDVHAHLGHDVVFDEEATEEELVAAQREYGVAASIVQPFVGRPYLSDTVNIHDRIHRLCLAHPGHFFGMASINPHFRPEDYEKEATRCVKELGFVGFKITPIAHAANPCSQDGLHVFETATALNTPVMVHTGNGTPFSDPIMVLEAAQTFRQIPIVLAHAGTDLLFAQALHLARSFDHVYLDTSWLSILNVRKALKSIGPGKMMFASDHAVNIPVELAKYRTLLEEGPELERVLGGTAREVFGIHPEVRS
ncbi:amidohydrolase family protein [Paenibacillus sp. YN15]|uniref:amidohydrolase family protein n=1 Tax=Paenibacillus sp. YN15 TaxID=1742774 RepID=UPI000DCD117B|nr:amidohydrolase family protein [Paenibacillus sp. YN15]RAV00135.1 amidohydrolase [Paenibacillus sp. YN15]